jgi:uncharacterized membrane protein YgdD (TMEM256/DUF423 family)
VSGRPWIQAGAALGFLAVGAGAFGAHGLKDRLAPKRLDNWETASEYALAHAVALVAVGLLAHVWPSKPARVAGWAFAAGVALFSGSLWALALTDVRALGMVTPFGGVGFLVGWVALALAARHLPATTAEPADRT